MYHDARFRGRLILANDLGWTRNCAAIRQFPERQVWAVALSSAGITAARIDPAEQC